MGPIHNACLALIGDAVLDVCALTQAYEALPDLAGSTESAQDRMCDRVIRLKCISSGLRVGANFAGSTKTANSDFVLDYRGTGIGTCNGYYGHTISM